MGVFVLKRLLLGLSLVSVSTASWIFNGGSAAINQGTFAGLPATCNTNDVFAQTDGPYLFRCSAQNVFSAFLETWGLVTVPPSAGWTSDNMSTATIDSTNGYRYFTNIPAGAGVRLQFRAAPATPYAIVAGVRHNVSGLAAPANSSNRAGYGIGFRDGTGKVSSFMYTMNLASTQSLEVDNWTSSTVFSANVATTTFGGATNYAAETVNQNPQWLCITDDGTTNVTYFWSLDRQHWRQFSQVARTSFLLAGPTQVFWGGGIPNDNAEDLALLDWTVNTAATCK